MKSFFLNKVLLFPYYFALKVRHLCYDRGIFKSYSFDVPVICIGNLSVGGTGKTPHTEFLVKELSADKRVAVLSRGYGRKGKGFKIVEVSGTAEEYGDEPLQIKRKFPEVTVAVDGNRVRGINSLLSVDESVRPQVIILDDAFQHRRVVPGKNILLIDHDNPPFCDNLLPFGRLRDLPVQVKRADIVIITKCPPEVSDDAVLLWAQKMRLLPHQKLLFSRIEYGQPVAIFEEGDKRYIYSKFALLITGIANPKPLEYHLSDSYKFEKKVHYRDHYYYSESDAASMNKLAVKYPKAVIITTEKDSQRLKNLKSLSEETKRKLFYYPIEVSILNQNGQFANELLFAKRD